MEDIRPTKPFCLRSVAGGSNELSELAIGHHCRCYGKSAELHRSRRTFAIGRVSVGFIGTDEVLASWHRHPLALDRTRASQIVTKRKHLLGFGRGAATHLSRFNPLPSPGFAGGSQAEAVRRDRMCLSVLPPGERQCPSHTRSHPPRLFRQRGAQGVLHRGSR